MNEHGQNPRQEGFSATTTSVSPPAFNTNPTDRSKSGSKRHLLTDGKGLPLAVVLSGANRHDMKKLADLLDASVIDSPSPSLVEQHLCLDRGYDYRACRQGAEVRGYIISQLVAGFVPWMNLSGAPRIKDSWYPLNTSG